MPCYPSYPSNSSSSNITIHSNYLDYSCNRKLPQYSPLYCTSHRDHLTPSATSFLVLAFGQKAGTSPCDEAHVPFTPLLFFALSTTPSLFSPLFSFLRLGLFARGSTKEWDGSSIPALPSRPIITRKTRTHRPSNETNMAPISFFSCKTHIPYSPPLLFLPLFIFLPN